VAKVAPAPKVTSKAGSAQQINVEKLVNKLKVELSRPELDFTISESMFAMMFTIFMVMLVSFITGLVAVCFDLIFNISHSELTSLY